MNSPLLDEERSVQEINKEFGIWLKAQRRLAGLLQKEVADCVPLARRQFIRIELGETGTKRDTVLSIVAAINKETKTKHLINLSEALSRFNGQWKSSQSAIESPDDLQLSSVCQRIQRLPPEEKAIILKLMEEQISSFEQKHQNNS